MFGSISVTWLDGSFFNILQYVDGMYLFFLTQAHILAKICFALSLGISCVKLALGATEVNKVLTQAFISIVTYFIMIFLFPHIMINMQKIVSELAYGAVFSQGFSVNVDDLRGKEDAYFKYLNEIGSDSKGNTIWTMKGERGDARKVLNLQITHKETGIISLNKVFQMIIATFKAMWKSLDIKGIYDFFTHFPDFLMVIVIGLAYLWALSTVIVQYAMVVVQYAFLYGLGVLFIPLMLWEGTKHAFDKLCGSIYNIGVRLLVIQIALYLAVMVNIDILKNMFILSAGKIDFLQGLEFYLSVAFMVVFVKLFVDQAPAIADFLCGGQPNMRLADFARAAAGGTWSNAGRSMAKGAAAVGALALTGGAAHMALNKDKAQGGDLVSSPGNFAKIIGQSAKQGGANVLDKRIDTGVSAPQPANSQGRLMAYSNNSESAGASASAPVPAPAGKQEGRHETGLRVLTEGERLMKSKNISEKVKGMSEQNRGKSAPGGNYSGLDARFKALKSSIGELRKEGKKEVNNADTAKGSV